MEPQEQEQKKFNKKEIIKKNEAWLSEARRGIERKGYSCSVKRGTLKTQPIRTLTFKYTIDKQDFIVQVLVKMLEGKIRTTVKNQEVNNTSIKDYPEGIKFGEKLVDYLPNFFEKYYNELLAELEQPTEETTEETTEKSTEVTTTTNTQPQNTNNQATEVKSIKNKSTIDLGTGDIIDAEVLKTEAYNIRMNNLNKLNEVFKNLLT